MAARSSSDEQCEYTLTVSNIPKDATKEELDGLAKRFEELDHVKHSGASFQISESVFESGEESGYVFYTNNEHVKEALEQMNGYKFKGQTLHVRLYMERHKKETRAWTSSSCHNQKCVVS